MAQRCNGAMSGEGGREKGRGRKGERESG